MGRLYTIPPPEPTEKRLNRYLGAIHPRPRPWKRYTDCDTYDDLPEGPYSNSRDWPSVLNPFIEWHLRNGALGKLLRESYNKDAWHGDADSLNTLITAVEHAFEDFPSLYSWTIRAWEYDPDNPAALQCVTGNGGNGEAEETEPAIIEVEETAVCTHFPGPGEFAVNVM